MAAWKIQRGRLGAIKTGYWKDSSIRTRSRLPIVKSKTIIMLTHLVTCLLKPDTLSLKSDVLDSDNSLLSLDAIIAPLKPIKRVRWDTKVCEAGIFANPEKKGRIISLMIKSENGSNTNNMNIMNAAKFSSPVIAESINSTLLSPRPRPSKNASTPNSFIAFLNW